MKKLLVLSIGTLLGGMLAAQSSIPDGGFEYWNTTTWKDPQFYTSSNDQNVPRGIAVNVSQTAGWHGTYGVQMTTISTPGGPQAGFMINGNPTNSGIAGGIPYNQKPTGVRFYYKYSPVSGDTAAVLVIFKKATIPIDSFLVILPVAQTNYTLYTYIPSVPLITAPDTVVFGAVSSLAAITSGGGNPGSVFVIDSVNFTGVSSQPANMNGDFENWNSDTLLTPPGWYISYPNVTFTTDAAVGTHALEIATVNNALQGGPEQGQASTGYYPNNCHSNCNEMGGQPYTPTSSKKDTLYFDYKYSPMPNDTASISLTFIKNGVGIYYAGNNYSTTVLSYATMSIPFDLTSVSPAPDTIIVNITSSQHNHDTTNAQYAPYVGSILKVDNMYLGSQRATLGVNNLSVSAGIKVYPNPAKNQITVDLTNISGSLETITMYDMSGRILSSNNYSGGIKNALETIDVSGFSSGIYLIEATTSNGRFYQKVSKE